MYIFINLNKISDLATLTMINTKLILRKLSEHGFRFDFTRLASNIYIEDNGELLLEILYRNTVQNSNQRNYQTLSNSSGIFLLYTYA